jgi:carboxypeptidase C (cathepsin A)
MTTYLNRADVKAALHVKSDITWADCSRSIRYDQKDGSKSMVPNYQYLLDNSDIDILVYSGDDDSVCGTVGTQDWIFSMGYSARPGSEWSPWNVPKSSGNNEAGQFAGYLTRFQGKRFAFATVHGAGHEVPTYNPAAAQELFSKFISGEWTNNM